MFDLAVIGLGPAGLEVVDIAIRNGLKVVAFEECKLGGTCLNQGCIPTKSILHNAKLYSNINNASKFGFNDIKADFSWQKILDRKDAIISKFNKALELALSKKITLINSKAELKYVDSNVQIISNNITYQAKNIIIATGSQPVEVKGLEFDHQFILNSDDMFKLSNLPQSIAIVGSGAIGLEWAKILSDFGVCVKLIEKASNLAPAMDVDIQKRVERILKTSNIDFFKNDFIQKIENKKLILKSGKELEVDTILCAVGRRANIPKIINNEMKIIVNDDYSTNIPNLYVVGDANSEILLAHAASYQAKIIMKKILFNERLEKKPVPSVIYISPEIASIGLREQDLDDISKYKIKKILIGSLAKSWCDDSSDGVVKVIIKDDLIVGAHVVSREASALISLFNIIIDKKITLSEISEMIFPHPSYSEVLLEVAKND